MKAAQYMKANATSTLTRAVEAITGRNRRNPGAAGSPGSLQAARSGVDKIKAIPANSSRWVGLNNASTSCSIPKMLCQVMSPAPPTANTTTPATARP
jgi:hypothetical protein